MELSFDLATVVHLFDLKELRLAGMDLIDDLHEGFVVCAAHDVVPAAANHEHGCADFLPDFTQVEGLELLVEGSGAAVLAVG